MSGKDALSFLSAAGPEYIAGLYRQYRQNPAAVDDSWAQLFGSLGDDLGGLLDDVDAATWRPAPEKIAAVLSSAANSDVVPASAAKKPEDVRLTGDKHTSALDSLRAYLLIRSYQVRGHFVAQIDPLGLRQHPMPDELKPETFGFTEKDYDREILLEGALGLTGATLREIVDILRQTYCGTIGVEFMHIQDLEQKKWLMRRIEQTRNRPSLSPAEKRHTLQRMVAAEGFEKFLDVKYTGTKRFGLEGGEATIPALEKIIEVSAGLGVREVLIGMAHRGRLNVLTNLMGQSFTAMFSFFQGKSNKPDSVSGSGDVKYHLGFSADRDFGGHTVHLSLTPNPSHLEFVDPIVAGKARAKQAIRKDENRDTVMAVLLHGDAAVSGQGVVMETLMMSELPGYRVGGTMHVVINNQIGFTTAPLYSRSGNYPTDVAKMVQSPVFHVNGDDVEAVLLAAEMAAEFRQAFKKDVFIDLVCYRRRGHNESDEPAFTQPQMYKTIHAKDTPCTLYARQLAAEGVVTEAEAEELRGQWNAHLEAEFAAAESYKTNRADMLEGQWAGLKLAGQGARRGSTAIPPEMAQKIGRAITTVPEGFQLNSKIARQMKAKQDMFATGEGFDWATAEALAFGSLALEGNPVRLSGQDCGRGTFSHRHAALIDQENEYRYIPLNNIEAGQAVFEVHDSPLSEVGVLGFEYGYSSSYPQALVLWEAQFGDFANGAQVIFDQFISSAETKWLRMSGLVVLLPHGFEGQGPEHSSARLERWLQMCAEDNWQVLNCSTPANYFHALRRQLRRDFRKPLMIMTPKSLLRHKRAVSPLSMMTGDQTFHRVLYEDQPIAPPEKIRRVVLCSGKVYYDLLEHREALGVDNVALLRLEQFYPFPDDVLGEELAKYPKAESVVWCQEEPENQGGWHFVDRRIEKVLLDIGHKASRPVYAGRAAAAAPATGLLSDHMREQKALLDQALIV